MVFDKEVKRSNVNAQVNTSVDKKMLMFLQGLHAKHTKVTQVFDWDISHLYHSRCKITGY